MHGDRRGVRGGRFARAAARAWRALPGDLIGAGAAGLAGASLRREVDVTLDDGRLLCAAVVIEDARLARWLERMPLSPVAMTFGRYVLARRALSDRTLRHELEHVRQWSRLGPLFLPAYLVDSFAAQALGGDRYRGNRFEVAAVAREDASPAAADGSAVSAASRAGEA